MGKEKIFTIELSEEASEPCDSLLAAGNCDF